MMAAAVAMVSETAVGSPARRLARRGVVVVPPPGVVVVPPAPIVAAPRPWRRLGVPPGVVVLPAVPGSLAPEAVIASAPALSLSPGRIASESAGAPVPRVAASPTPATPPPTPGFKPTPAAPSPAAIEEIPAPLPAPEKTAVAGGPIAFSPEWYSRHPDAWRPAGPPANWWKVADAASVTDWIAGTVALAGGAAGAGRVAQAGGEQPGADGLRSVLVLQSGHGPEAAAGDWLPLGVFAVVPPGGGSAHNYQQLVVDRSGAIRGNFYDAISDTVLPITGSVDRTTLRAAWSVASNGSRFETAVASLAAPPRKVSVSSGDGSRDLELVPIDGP